MWGKVNGIQALACVPYKLSETDDKISRKISGSLKLQSTVELSEECSDIAHYEKMWHFVKDEVDCRQLSAEETLRAGPVVDTVLV